MSEWERAARFESNWLDRDGLSMEDVHFSRLSGMAPADIETLRDFSRNHCLLLVIRCPKRAARYYHGLYQPKTMQSSMLHLKSDPRTGLVTRPDGRVEVSDYDLMCVYRFVGHGQFEKIKFSGVDPTNKRSRLSDEATGLLVQVQKLLLSPFQHGAQDDWIHPENPGVGTGGKNEEPDRFMVFIQGRASFFAGPRAVQEKVYVRFGLHWPYTETRKPGRLTINLGAAPPPTTH